MFSPSPVKIEMGKRQSRLRPDGVEELVKATHFTPKELNRWYRGFLRDCPTGTLTEQEFCQNYGQLFPFGDPEPLASLVFRGFGMRGDGGEGSGVVGFTQFITALSTITRGSIEERIALLFRLYDNDSDGSIDREDIEKVMEAMYKMVSPLLAQEKEGSNGEEGTEETNIISASMSARVKEICSKLDKDGVGKVGLDQFTEAVKEDQSISLALQHQQQLLL